MALRTPTEANKHFLALIMAMATDSHGFDSRISVAQRQGSMAAVKKSVNILSRYPFVAAYKVETTVSRHGMPRPSGMGRYVHSNRACERFSWPERSPPTRLRDIGPSCFTRRGSTRALRTWKPSLARLDYAFVLPGGFRYGLGGFIGLLPGIGDIFDALFSLYIVGCAVQLKIPRITIARMIVNVAIESFAGAATVSGRRVRHRL